jgi:hypothetical protein
MLGGRTVKPNDGWSLGFIGGLGMIWAEGHPGGETLGAASSAIEASTELRQWLAAHGIRTEVHPYRESGGVARLDSTVNVPMGSDAEARTFLAGIAAVDAPRLKPVVYGKPPETVALLHVTGRRTLGRVYHYERSRGLPTAEGVHVRMEDQRRFQTDQRLPAAIVDERVVRRCFENRFVPLYRAARSVKCAGLPVVMGDLAGKLRDGEISVTQFKRSVAYVGAEVTGTTAAVFPKRSARRARQDLREAGLVLADDFFEPVEVELGAVIERALEEGVWASG